MITEKNPVEKKDLSEVNPSPSAQQPEKKKKREQGIGRMALRIVARNFWSFFFFELLYKLLTFSIVIPLIRKISYLVLYLNGISNLTDDNFFQLMANPVTWIGLIIAVLIAAMMISVEFAGLFGGIHASQEGRKISVKEMFFCGIEHCTVVMNPKNWMYLIYLIIVMPLASIGESATMTKNYSIPDFIMEGINEKWYLSLIYTVGTLAIMYLAMRWIYVLPAMNVRHKNFKEASKESGQLMHHRLWKSIWAILSTYLFLFTILAVLAVAILLASFGIVHWLEPNMDLTKVITPVALADLVTVYIILIVTSSPLVLSRIYIGYQRLVSARGEEIPPYQKPDSVFTRSRIFKIGLTVCLLAGIYFFVPARYQEVKLVLNNASARPLVMAHRGDSVDAPENTLPAFQAAIDRGADAAEMDVQMTKDGTIVVLHDSSIDRTSTGHGNIWDVTYDEIKNLDNGSFFSEEFTDTRIPTLDQVIKLCKGKLYLNIEIKRTGHDEGIEQKVLDVIKTNGFQDQCDITSMDYTTLATVRSLDPTIKTVYTTTVALGSIADLTAADAFSVETTFVTQSFMREMQHNGKEVFVWTVNSPESMEKMAALGVNAIITNDPVECRAIVDKGQSEGVYGVLKRLNTAVLGM